MFRLRINPECFRPPDLFLIKRKGVGIAARCCAQLLVCLSLLCLAAATCSPAIAQSTFLGAPRAAEEPATIVLPQYNIRVLWGGGEAKKWRGHFELNNGFVDQARPLGLESDASAALHIAGKRLNLNSLRPSGFSGFDVQVNDSTDNKITIRLQGAEGKPFQQSIDLSPLLTPLSVKASIQLDLDESGNRMEIIRSPGDRLPVEIERSHLVFRPGEELTFTVPTFALPNPKGSALLETKVVSATSAKTFDSQSTELTESNELFERKQPIRITLPNEEGVYFIQLDVRSDSFARRLNLDRPILSRKIQVVVVQDELPAIALADAGQSDRIANPVVLWKEIYNTDQLRRQWLDRLPGMNQFRLASSKGDNLRNEGVTAKEEEGQVWTEFAPGGWQAVPLQISQIDKPHIVEIEYLSDGPMTMGISVLQPDGSGQVQPFGVDSGINIPRSVSLSGEPTIARHRIFFWPQHNKPYLLFANRHNTSSARIGKIRVLAGPERLAASDADPPHDLPTRKVMAFYEKPLFAENFASNQSIDATSGQAYHDWRTFLDGANRWTQYLKANGYTGAMIVVAGDGSALYPSTHLNPSPRFDSGAFDANGSDPMRKDVVELLLRVFQREGLQLVPVLNFNQPLPELEKQIAESPAAAVGLTLTNLRGANRYPELLGNTSSVSVYNPLDTRVQFESTAIVDEFLARYRDRQAFAGLGLLMSRDSLQVLPGQTWGADATTLRRFATDHQFSGSDDPATQFNAEWLIDLLGTEQRQAWLQWRQRQLGDWMQGTQQRLAATRSDRQLYLLGTDMLEAQDAFSAIAPSLRRNADIIDALARIGFPTETISNNKEIVFLRPFELAPERNLASKRLSVQLKQSEATRNVLQQVGQGVLFTHRSSWAEFQQLQQQKLFADTQTQPIMRIQPLTPAGSWARQRFIEGLVHGDGKFLVDGGWLANLGQEEHLTRLLETYTKLPTIPFVDLPVDNKEQPQDNCGLVVRQASGAEDRTYFYIANPTPWPVTATIQLTGRNTLIESLDGEEFLFDEETATPQFTTMLPAFSMRAGYFSEGVQISACQSTLPDEVARNLQDRLNGLLAKASQAANAEAIDVLQNPNFDTPNQNGQQPIAGWRFDSSLAGKISIKSNAAFNGQSNLELTSDGQPTWLRSHPINVPETGRLSVSVMIRATRTDVQPPLRISIQGNDGRQVYYRYGTVGDQQRQVTGEWQEFAVHFDDLPLFNSNDQSRIEIGFDLMGQGQVELDNVRVFDRWLDAQDSRSLTQLLALAGFQLNSQRNPQRCREILDGYWPRFLEEFFPDLPQADESTASREARNRSSR